MPGVEIKISELKGETRTVGTYGTPTLYCSARVNFALQSMFRPTADANVVVHFKVVNKNTGDVVYDKDVVTEILRLTKGKFLEQERVYTIDTGIYNTQSVSLPLTVICTITASYAPLFGVVLRFTSKAEQTAEFTLPERTTTAPPQYQSQEIGTTVSFGFIGLKITKVAENQWQVTDFSGPTPRTITKVESLPLPPQSLSNNVQLAAWLDKQYNLPSPTIRTTDVKTILWLTPAERETFMKQQGYVAQVVGGGVKPPTTPIAI